MRIVVMMQACFFLMYGIASGLAFHAILEQRVAEERNSFLVQLPLNALSQIKVEQQT